MNIWLAVAIFAILLVLEWVFLFFGYRIQNQKISKIIILCGAIASCVNICFVAIYAVKRLVINPHMIAQATTIDQFVIVVSVDIFMLVACMLVTGIGILFAIIMLYLSQKK